MVYSKNGKKSRLTGIVLMLAVLTLFVSCDKLKFTPDKNLIYGTWKTGETYYRFDNSEWNYTLADTTTVKVNGVRWNPSEDVTEAEGQPFKWTLTEANLTIVHQQYMGGVVPKTYTVKSLTTTTMTWQDNYGNTTTLDKQ